MLDPSRTGKCELYEVSSFFLGIFFVFYLLFSRYFPVMPIAELKTILKSSGKNYKEGYGRGKGYWDKNAEH